MVEAEQLRHDFADVVLAFVGNEHARFDAIDLQHVMNESETALHAEVQRHFTVGTDVSDIAMAKRYQVACGQFGSLLVIDAHGGVEAALFRQARIDADDWHID